MREILFRGKKETLTEENKKYTDGWVYSDTLYQDDDGVYLIPLGVSAESYHLGKYNFRANSDKFEIMVAKIKPETLGQYTGIKDKNGTKIFEGDILCMTFKDEWTNNEDKKVYYFIKFNDGMFATFYYDFLDEVEEDRLCEALIEIDKLEVVGNIYDNPQLL